MNQCVRQESHEKGIGDFNDWVYEDEEDETMDDPDDDWEYWDEEDEVLKLELVEVL